MNRLGFLLPVLALAVACGSADDNADNSSAAQTSSVPDYPVMVVPSTSPEAPMVSRIVDSVSARTAAHETFTVFALRTEDPKFVATWLAKEDGTVWSLDLSAHELVRLSSNTDGSLLMETRGWNAEHVKTTIKVQPSQDIELKIDGDPWTLHPSTDPSAGVLAHASIVAAKDELDGVSARVVSVDRGATPGPFISSLVHPYLVVDGKKGGAAFDFGMDVTAVTRIKSIARSSVGVMMSTSTGGGEAAIVPVTVNADIWFESDEPAGATFRKQ